MIDGRFHVQAFSIQQPGSRGMLMMIRGSWISCRYLFYPQEAANNTCASWPPSFWRHL
ncbi:hypothetical protein NEUTE1DRAFT_37248 [Neurospora tetrasperma FGSC 2508]|uniref:Uncharacterized protein n=1 Tax=Neurospora tetrasperma (strain FGSC 2508 / ATCC MYA-4615 / P0657) TaxID=510951 RepID=F8MED0_NEUT8|nr:uncharacterized protein NEUTE1DRAFT_37248 [Neurospora tetrasperma FGSC 2508]EGO61612.1 hypothetical protein NEUTE1DRAFT_37248 [Neurospora tetrasperma FGSC 2508]EGZ74344.1 hypothetical protein NEUTE2DRAFT_57752 [Neurospora tetrasperma FGSC 2509]